MADPLIDIPDRAAFKAAEVCEIAQIPLYVLRSWEKEFAGLGVASKPGGPRVYRRRDVEQVLKIKQLLFAEGLTLSGARRKLEGEPPPEVEAEPGLPVPEEVRAKVTKVKTELRSLLDLLSGDRGQALPPAARPAPEPSPEAPARTWPPRRASDGPMRPASDGLPLLNGTPGTEGGGANTEGAGRKAEGGADAEGGERKAQGGAAEPPTARRPRRSRRTTKEPQ